MKKNHIARSSILLLLLLAFGITRAQVTVTPTITPACHSNDGAVTFTITGATGPFNYTLYNTYSGVNTTQSSGTFTGLDPVTYWVSINYASGSSIDSSTITIPPAIGISLIDTVAICPATTANPTVAASGGTGPYSYLWNTGATTTTLSGASTSNVYSVTATDVNGCSAVRGVSIDSRSPVSVLVGATGITCNPTLVATPSGGTGTYTYHWNTGATTASISSLTANTYYTVTATDANGCAGVQQYYLGSTALNIDSSNNSSVAIVNPSCTANTGSITLHVRSGVAPYTFHWTGSASTDSIASGLAVGQYTVTVTDANGCSGTGTYYLNTQNPVYGYIGSYTNPTCGASDGSATVSSYSGSGSYTYLWSNGATTANISGLAANTYTVTVSDGTGCTSTASITLSGVANYTVSVTTTPTACDTSLHTGTATAIVGGTGGTAPYTFTWYSYYAGSTVIGTTQTITNLGTNSYLSVVVKDANGCKGANYDSVFASIPLDPSCYDHITGYAYNDSISNCVKDAPEHGITGAYIYAIGTNGQSYYATPDSTGFYDIEVSPGTYTVSARLTTTGACAGNFCTASYTATFTAISQVSSGNDFGADLGTATYNLGVHPGCTSSTPGASKEYWVYYYNYGQTSAPGTVLTFTHDPNLTLTSSTPAYSSYDATTHVVTFNLGNQATTFGSWTAVHMFFDVPSTLTLGSYLTSVAQITPITGDCDPSDNTASMSDMVSGSHDPNEKEVIPAGNLTESDSVLNYTVRFQNDGNAPANLVVIKDTLSPNVDPLSVIAGASSHPYKMTLTGKGILTFTFENINLPDSVHDEPHSKGFVNYSVHTKPNLALGTQVKNTASIYFDINPAVVTNTTVSERSDFSTGIKNVNGNGGMAVTVAPNPVHDISVLHITGATGDVQMTLTDVTGQKVMETKTAGRDIKIEGASYAPGLYLYTVKDATGKSQSGKVLIAQ